MRAFNSGKPAPLGKRIVVIGGGNVAYDVARSRAFAPARTEQVAYDVARSALRLSADKEVHVVCLESREEMPADDIEVIEGAEEGIRLHNRRGPREILVEDGRVTALRTVHCTSVFDAAGRFNPSFDESQVEDIPADSVIFAIGQTSDLSFLDPADGVQSDRGLIKVNRETYQTTAPDVFACGDIAHGARLFIDAIASAQIAARSMHDYLRGTRTDVVVRKKWTPAAYTMADGWNVIPRRNPPIQGQRGARRDARDRGVELSRSGGAAAGRALPAVQRQHGFRDRQLRSLQRLRGRLSGEPDSPGGPEPVDRGLRLDGKSRGRVRPRNRRLAARGTGPTGRGDDEGRDHLHPLRTVRLALPAYAIAMKRFDFYRECVTVAVRNPKVQYPA